MSLEFRLNVVQLFGWQTFKRVGASCMSRSFFVLHRLIESIAVSINRIYKLVLVLSIVLQLSLFFMGATVSLFLDQLFNGWAGQLAWYRSLYKVMFIVTGLVRGFRKNDRRPY
jgi:hypothetical protein